MIWEISNLYTRYAGTTASEDALMREILTRKEPIRGFRGRTTGYRELSMLVLPEREFPSGLVPYAYEILRERGVTPKVVDCRVRPCEIANIDLPFLNDLKRGPFQRAAVDAVCAAGRGIIWAPTGTGKTQIAVAVARKLPVRWAFLVDDASLLGQTVDRYNAWSGDSEPAGIIGAGRWQEARFCVATYQTLYQESRSAQFAAWAPTVQGLFFDELQVVAADKYLEVTMSFPNAYFRVGMSATPLHRGPWDNLRVLAATGRVIYRAEVAELVRAGVISQGYVEMLPFEHRECLSPTWNGVYGELIVRNRARNAAIVEHMRAAEKPALLFVKEIKHGQALLEALQTKKVKAEFVHGDASLERRKEAIKRVICGDTEVIVTNRVFQKGVDIPPLATILVASGGASIVDSIQRAGRGSRTAEGKSSFKVLDFYDFGHPWIERHALERQRAYRMAGFLFPDDTAQQTLSL